VVGEGWRFDQPLESVYSLPAVNGFDSRCLLTRLNMPAQRGTVVDANVRFDLVQLFNILDRQYVNLTQAVEWMETILGPGATIAGVDNSPTSNVPGTVIGTNATQTIVAISGTTTAQQLATQLGYGAIGIVDYGAFSTLPVWYSSATAIVDRMLAQGIDTSKPITLVGHSYGGALAILIAALIKRANPTADVRIVTAGAPNPGDQRLYDLLAGVPQVHIVNVGDPVPGLPPTGPDLVPWSLIVPSPLYSRWGTVRQLPGRSMLASSGQITVGNPWFYSFSALSGAIPYLVSGASLPLFSEHEMSTYLLWAKDGLLP